MFKLTNKKPITEVVRGIFTRPIQYEVRLPSGDWTPYFGKYQNQKWAQWDSNSCWKLSQINCSEDQLEFLAKNNFFGKEAMDFFTSNGYIDEDGDFSISERYGEILGKRYINGGDEEYAWQLDQMYGCIPRSMLTYTHERAASFPTYQGFVDDYFNMHAITPEMRALGQKFLQYVNISYQKIGKMWYTPPIEVLRAALKQAPLQIGIPIPKMEGFVMWNVPFVKYHGERTLEHAVQLYRVNDDGSYAIFDQYLPNLKTLSADYYIPRSTQGILMAVNPNTENPIKQDSYWNSFWQGCLHWYNGIFDSKVPIGKL